MSLVLLLGGVRGGKSSFAVRLAGEQATLVATGTAGDDEMAERIRSHQAERPAGWTTVEEPLRVGDALASRPPDEPVVIDCLTLWVSNLLGAGRTDDEALADSSGVAAAAAARPGLTVAVSNEVGMGVVPATPLGRRYRDVLGAVNAAWAAEADRVLLVVAGRALELHAVG